MSMPAIDLLAPDNIAKNLLTEIIGSKIIVYDNTSSTNDVAARYAQNKENHGLVIFAEQQTAGRGRNRSEWQSPKAQSILCSAVLIGPQCTPELLSLAAAVAVAQTICSVVANHVGIKWPNDIMIKNKKIAGILLESKPLQKNIAYIIGIGINCHQKKNDFTPPLRQIATSIDIENKATSDRRLIAADLLSSLDHYLQIAQNNPDEVIAQWRKHSLLLGRRLTLVCDGREFVGNCIGLDPHQGLVLQLDTGAVRMFHTAHTTIIS